MGYENVILGVDGSVATITINRPKVLNALNTATLDELLDVQKGIDTNEQIRVVGLGPGRETSSSPGATYARCIPWTRPRGSSSPTKGISSCRISRT